MTNYKRGDIVLVDFIFSTGTGIKKRPALIISGEKYNNTRQDIIIAAITSNISRNLFGDTMIEHWQAAGLLKPSVCAGIIQTINFTLIERKLGEVVESDLKEIIQNLKLVFEI